MAGACANVAEPLSMRLPSLCHGAGLAYSCVVGTKGGKRAGQVQRMRALLQTWRRLAIAAHAGDKRHRTRSCCSERSGG